MDETYKVAITRLGNRIRVGGTAELVGFSTRLREPRRATLEHSLKDLFPRGGDLSAATFWTGLRPMTPDGTPIIGPTRYTNLYLNTGHGTLGWTMACGSGRVLADIISGRKPDIEHADRLSAATTLKLPAKTELRPHRRSFVDIVKTEQAPQAIGPYSQAIIVDKWLFSRRDPADAFGRAGAR